MARKRQPKRPKPKGKGAPKKRGVRTPARGVVRRRKKKTKRR